LPEAACPEQLISHGSHLSGGGRVLEVDRVDVVITEGRTERLPQLNVGNAG